MNQSHILLAGGTGYIGREVGRELIQRGHAVSALMRADSAAPNRTIVDASLTGARPLAWPNDLSAADALPDDIDTVVSCIASRSGVADDAWAVDYDTNRRLLDAAKARGARRFILLSAICVQKPRLAFQFAKRKFEQELAASGLDYAIVRPTAYFKSLAGQLGRIQAGKPYLMFGDGELTACKPISAPDLARYMVDAVDAPQAANTILPIGGPGEAITPREQGEMLFELSGKTPAFRRVSPAVLRVAAGVLSVPGWLLSSARAKAELARIGHYYATESMLVWDDTHARYSAEQTPSYGSDTLRDFFAHALTHGLDGQELGEHRMFS